MAITAETRQDIIELVVTAYNAAPGTTLLTELVAIIDEGGTLADVAANLTTSARWKSTYPAFQTAEEFAEEWLGNLVPEAGEDELAEGVSVAVGLINGGASFADLLIEASTFLSALSEDDEAFGSSAANFNNKVEVATYHTITQETDGIDSAVLDSVTSDDDTVETAKSSVDTVAPASGKTYTLTTGVDKPTGLSTDDTFSATGATLGSLDVITGGEGTDTLVIKDTTEASSAGLKGTISGVEVLDLTSDGGMGAVAVAATAAGTNTAAVVQKATLLASGEYKQNDVITLTVGSYTKDLTISSISNDDYKGRVDALTAVKNELTAILGDAITFEQTPIVHDSGTANDSSTFVQSALTYKSNIAGTALPAISVATKTAQTGSTGETVQATTNVGTQTAALAVAPVVANVVATGANAAKEVKQIALSEGANTPAAFVKGYKVTIGDTVYTGDSSLGSVAAGSVAPADLATDLVRIINSALGSSVATNLVGTTATATITLTAPTAGTALPLISIDYVEDGSNQIVKPAEAYSTLVSNTAANSAAVAGTDAVAYKATGFDTVKASVEGDINTTLGAAATATLATTAGSATVSGGADVTVTATKAVTLSGAALSTASVTTGTTSAAINIGATGSTATTVAPKLVSATVKGGSDVVVADYSKGVSSGTLTSVTIGGTKDATVTLAGKALTDLTVSSQSVATDITIDSTGATDDHTLNLTLSAAGKISATAPKVVEITDARAETVDITVTKASNIKLDGDSGLTLVNVSGAGDLEIDLDTTNNGTKTFDGAAATGDIDITSLSSATKTVHTGAGDDTVTTAATAAFVMNTNAGNDVVTIGAATAAGTSINLGDGDDILLKGGSGSVSIDSAGDVTTIDGGAGNNVIASTLITAGNADQFTGFNVLGLATSSGTFDAALLSGVTALHALATGGTYSSVTPAMSVTYDKNSSGTGTNTLSFATGTATGSDDTVTVNITNTQTSATATAASPQAINNGTLVAEGTENYVINSNSVGYVQNDIDVTSAKLKTVTVNGSATGTKLAFGTSGTNTGSGEGGAVNAIDASGYSGDIEIDTSNVTADDLSGVGLTITTAGGDDKIVLAQSATVIAGAGDDRIETSGSGAITVMTGGAGNDHFDVELSTGTSGGAVIMDLESFDKIEVAGSFTAASLGAAEDVGAATSLAAALEIANGSANSANDLTWFQYGGNTYIYSDLADSNNAVGGLDANDNVVKIIGLIDLEASPFTAAGIITVI